VTFTNTLRLRTAFNPNNSWTPQASRADFFVQVMDNM
jgi:hypothetical protein